MLTDNLTATQTQTAVFLPTTYIQITKLKWNKARLKKNSTKLPLVDAATLLTKNLVLASKCRKTKT